MNRHLLMLPLLLGFLTSFSSRGQDVDEIQRVFPLGDATKGKSLFESKLCSRCHTVEGAKFPEYDLPAIDFIHLAGENNRGWNRDIYATQIMDPQHLISPDHQKAMLRIGDRLAAENSPMLDYNQSLTMGDLVDLVTFLEVRTAEKAKED